MTLSMLNLTHNGVANNLSAPKGDDKYATNLLFKSSG